MSWLFQIKRYVTVGIGSALTDLSIYGLLIHYGNFTPLAANFISRPCGGMFSFTFNKIWTFKRDQLAGTPRELIRFGFVWSVSYGASLLLVWLFHRFFSLHPGMPQALSGFLQSLSGWSIQMVEVLPKLCAEGLVCIGLFLSHRFWTFRHH